MKSPPDEFAISPPAQRRSREAWNRILDAGVELIEEGGYEAFTIAALCKRAGVAPSAVYDRADSKDAVFLATYEHAHVEIKAEYAALDDGPQWESLAAEEIIRRAVRTIGELHLRHARFLRSVILISGAHPEVYRRGASQRRELAARFHALLGRLRDDAGDPLSGMSIETIFTAVFSTMSLRISYGPDFTPLAVDDEALLDELAAMAVAYLLKRGAVAGAVGQSRGAGGRRRSSTSASRKDPIDTGETSRRIAPNSEAQQATDQERPHD